METSDVRRRVHETIERAKRGAADRRVRNDDATTGFEEFLERTAVPLFRQVANVLRIENFAFTVFTPSGSVRLMSDRRAEDFIEVSLDTSGDSPQVMGHSSHSRGRRVVESEEALGNPASVTEDQLLAFVIKGLEPFVER